MAPLRITQTFIPLPVAHNERNRIKSRVVSVASWAGLMASPYIAAYNASKFALIGLTESMFYDLRLFDIHAVLAIPGITRTPLLAKTTADGAASLEAMSPHDRARYEEGPIRLVPTLGFFAATRARDESAARGFGLVEHDAARVLARLNDAEPHSSAAS